MKEFTQPELNLRVILAFLENHQTLTEQERREILKTISLLNSPIFTTS